MRLRWKGSINQRVPSGDMASRNAIAEAPSATPISTRLDLPVAHSTKAPCSPSVCCPKTGRIPNQANTGWRSSVRVPNSDAPLSFLRVNLAGNRYQSPVSYLNDVQKTLPPIFRSHHFFQTRANSVANQIAPLLGIRKHVPHCVLESL